MIPSVLRSCNILQAHLLLSLKSMASSLVCWATIWDWTKDTQSFSASSGAISYPSVRRAGRREPWERGCNLFKSCIDHLFCCSNAESLSSIRRHIPNTLSLMRYKSVVWRKCKKKIKRKNERKTERFILWDRLDGLVPYPGDSGLSKRVDNYDKLYTVFADWI